MSLMYCGACGANFTSLRAFDQHLLLYPDLEGAASVNVYEGRPVCIGERDGRAAVDESGVEKLRERMSALRTQSLVSASPTSLEAESDMAGSLNANQPLVEAAMYAGKAS